MVTFSIQNSELSSIYSMKITMFRFVPEHIPPQISKISYMGNIFSGSASGNGVFTKFSPK